MGLRVLVVQHADKERLPGDPGLTPLGREQAERTASWLERSEEPSALWCSPMRRAVETADALASALAIDVVQDERLRERMNWEGGDETLGGFLAEWQRASTDRSYVPPSGDSSISAATRFLEALDDLAGIKRCAPLPAGPGQLHRPRSEVVVAHGGVTTDVLRTVLGDDEVERRAPGLVAGGVPSCAITTLEREGDRWRVRSIASTDHLAP